MATQQTISSSIIESVTIGTKIYSIQKAGNMFLVRENNTTLKWHKSEDEARKHLSVYKKYKKEGGERKMIEEAQAEKDMAEVTDEALANPGPEIDESEDPAIQSQLDNVKVNTVAELYGNKYANAGTEEMNQDDVNTPYLILLQSNTDIEDKKVGWFYRSDTKEMMETVDVNFVYVTSKQLTNKKGEPYTAKEYYGFFADSQEPFKLKMKGWGLATHRELQTEIRVYQAKLKTPMCALTVRLSSERKEGTITDGNQYKIEKIVANVLKHKDGLLPVIEQEPDRVGFLLEAVDRFKAIAPVQTDEDAAREGMPF